MSQRNIVLCQATALGLGAGAAGVTIYSRSALALLHNSQGVGRHVVDGEDLGPGGGGAVVNPATGSTRRLRPSLHLRLIECLLKNFASAIKDNEYVNVSLY